MTIRLQSALWYRLAVLLTVVGCVAGCGRGSITIKDNGYRNILVAIGESVEENPVLIERIREVFTQASSFLYNVTRQRAFFKEITILVPNTWSDGPHYMAAGQEAVDKSDILIDESRRDEHLDDPSRKHEPYVLRSTPCGTVGHYMSLTPQYILDASIAQKHGPYGKSLVHEWAHLRYGVFDEYPGAGGPFFYTTGSSGFQAVRCSTKLKGTEYNKVTRASWCYYSGSLPDGDCRFQPAVDASQPPGQGSIMFATYLDHVTEFCDNDPSNPLTEHTAEADNKQNRLCDSKSVWEVLREHDDFRDANEARDVDSTVPEFTMVRTGVRRTVLVLDVSGSMKEEVSTLAKGCISFITDSRDGEKVAIVTFSSAGEAVRPLTVISSATRQDLGNAIPKTAGGGTSIGAGLRKALEVLKQDGSPRGATFIVVSDGEETGDPRIADVLPEIRTSGVTVHTLAFTDLADSTLDSLAQVTGGLAFLYSNADRSNALFEAFQAFLEFNIETRDRKYPISSNAFPLAAKAKQSGEVVIDEALGRNTEFVIDYSGDGVTFTITSPTGKVYDNNSPQVTHDSQFGIYRLNFIKSKPGVWRYTINNEQLSSQKVSVAVRSQPQTQGSYPIIAQTFWGHKTLAVKEGSTLTRRQNIYASISKGYNAVLHANVAADVECPNGDTVKKTLLDNGAGADQIKDDGIYSSYFTQFCGSGRYNLKVTVNNSDVTVVSPVRIVGQGAPTVSTPPADGPPDPTADIPVTLLQRVAVGGSFSLQLPDDTSSAGGAGGGSVVVPLYPPGRVSDLTVTTVHTDNQTVHLAWTAVGAQLDQGTVTEYVLRFATNFTVLKRNFEAQSAVSPDMVTWGNLSSPAPPDQPETVRVRVPRHGNVTYFFALVAIDRRGRDVRGDVSNIVSAGMTSYEALNPPRPRDNGGGLLAANAVLFVVQSIVLLWGSVWV